jgi:DNA-binding MarR family transcriptional regulator
MSTTRSAGLQQRNDGTPGYEHGGGFLLARLGAMAEGNWKIVITEAGLTQAEFTILTVLSEGARLRQRDVAARAAIDARNAVPIVSNLTARGLVLAEPDIGDARAKMLRISSKGTTLMETITDRLRGERSDFFSPLSSAEYSHLCELLSRVYRARIDGT